MKRKGLALDFTSFLDVILILLFMVVVGMSRVALSAGEASDQALAEAAARIEAVSAERDAFEAEAALLHAKEGDYGALHEELEALQDEYAALRDDYDHLRITSGYDEDDISAYQAAIERMTKVALICTAERNAAAGNPQVKVDVYLDSGQPGERSYVDSIVIVHDFSLTAEQRARLRGEQVAEATGVLTSALRGGENRMVWFTIQYAYDDINFSHSDLRILEEAIANLERSLPVSCYTERIKLY